jgi:hypothetical protein
VPGTLNSASVKRIRKEMIWQADFYLSSIKNQAFRIPANNYFYWGSNPVFTNAGFFLIIAYLITQVLILDVLILSFYQSAGHTSHGESLFITNYFNLNHDSLLNLENK